MPLLSSTHTATGAHLALWHITESADRLRAMLSQPDLHAGKTAGLRPASRRLREVLAVRCLLRAMLGTETEVRYHDDGRPWLDNGTHISITHTEGYAAVILSSHPAGIDIERIGNRVQRVVSHFVHPAEEALLDTPLALHLAWSAKETAFKLLGSSYYDLRRLTHVTHIDSAGRQLCLHVEAHAPLLIHFSHTPDYVLTWCEHPHTPTT